MDARLRHLALAALLAAAPLPASADVAAEAAAITIAEPVPAEIVAGYRALNALKAQAEALEGEERSTAEAALTGAEARLRAASDAAFATLEQADRTLAEGRRELAAMTRGDAPSPLQSRAVRESWIARYDRARGVIGGFEGLTDPRIDAAQGRIGPFADAFRAEMARAKAQLDALGDLDARRAALAEGLASVALPEMPEGAPTGALLAAWLDGAKAARRAAEANLGTIREAAAPLADGEAYADLAASERETLDALRRDARTLAARATEGLPDDPSDRRRLAPFIDAGDRAGAEALLDEAAAALGVAATIERVAGMDVTRRERALARIEQARAAFARDFERGRLPAARSEDPALLAAAEAVLARPESGFGRHGPIVLTMEGTVRREKEESRTTIDGVRVDAGGDVTLSGTEETWRYVWDEFRFASPIRAEDGNWHLWWITARRYESHWDERLVGRWISAKAVKGDPIPEARFR